MNKQNTEDEEMRQFIKEITAKNPITSDIKFPKSVKQAEKAWIDATEKFFDNINEEQTELLVDMIEKEFIYNLMEKNSKNKNVDEN